MCKHRGKLSGKIDPCWLAVSPDVTAARYLTESAACRRLSNDECQHSPITEAGFRDTCSDSHPDPRLPLSPGSIGRVGQRVGGPPVDGDTTRQPKRKPRQPPAAAGQRQCKSGLTARPDRVGVKTPPLSWCHVILPILVLPVPLFYSGQVGEPEWGRRVDDDISEHPKRNASVIYARPPAAVEQWQTPHVLAPAASILVFPDGGRKVDDDRLPAAAEQWQTSRLPDSRPRLLS